MDEKPKSINARQGLIFVLLLLALVTIGIGVAVQRAPLQSYSQPVVQTAPTTINSASYSCSENKGILAFYVDGGVVLRLSDSRQFTLEQTVSASGARYANENDQFVFWNKGDTAFVEEDGEMTYSDCVAAQ